MLTPRCADCYKMLTDDEVEFLGERCSDCEYAMWDELDRDEDMPARPVLVASKFEPWP